MKSISTAILLIACAALSNGQSAPRQNEPPDSPAAMRIRALQSQINKQQLEIKALRSGLGKLQNAMQELADTIADQTSDTDQDTNDSDVTGLVVKSPSNDAKRSVRPMLRSAIGTHRSAFVYNHQCGPFKAH